MCGFIGHLSKNIINHSKLEIANERIVCRGPDSCKKINFQHNQVNFSLFFNRLRILDLSEAADQPMWSEGKRSVLMFNGEIYNHKSLREKLSLNGTKFSTKKSDTETILKGLDFYGEDFIKQLRGQFSIFYYNFHKNEVILSRDRLGQKPLYYKLLNDKLTFSSNLKSLLDFEENLFLRKESLIDYIKYGSIPSPNTLFKNIFKVRPAETLKIFLRPDGFSIKKSNYWDVKDYLDYQEFNKEEFFEIFSESVKVRQVADVEIANFLSGGIDSSSIVKNMFDNGSKINSFSVNVDNSKYDESKWSRLVSEKYDTNHIEVDVNSKTDFEYYTLPLKSLDEPYSDPSVIPSFYLSKEISKYYKVAISGDGGDELLGGYKRVNKTFKNVGKFSNLISRLYYFYPSILGTGNYFLSKNKDIDIRYKSFLEDINFLNLLGLDDLSSEENLLFLDKNIDSYKSILITEYKFFLSDMMLFKVDRTSMYHSVEVRSPFLDHELLEYIFSHSVEYVDINQPKKILKDYLISDFDINFVSRSKQGFVFDIENWIYKNYENIFSILENGKVSTVLDIYKLKYLQLNKSRINAHRIWKVFVLNYYLDDISFNFE